MRDVLSTIIRPYFSNFKATGIGHYCFELFKLVKYLGRLLHNINFTTSSKIVDASNEIRVST